MSFYIRNILLYSALVCINLLSYQYLYAADDNWRIVSTQELAQKTPEVESDADAEAIFWETNIDDSPDFTTIWRHYIRVKIFSERGREKFSKVRILIPEGGKVSNIQARVIKADGTIFELKKEDVFVQEIIKTKYATVSAVSFAVPNLEVGAIFDYKYEESSLQLTIGDKPLIFQRDIPVQKISYTFKPIQDAEVVKSFINMSEPEITVDSKGFYQMTLKNVPSLKEEIFMPPEKEVERWMFVSYFSRFSNMKPENFWQTTASGIISSYKLKNVLKPDAKLREKALEITKNQTTDEGKIFTLAEFCRTSIDNLDYSNKLSADEKNKIRLEVDAIKPVESPTYTLKKSRGFSLEINELFAALASSLGYDTRYAFTGNRNEIFFSQKYKNRNLFHFACVAVKVSGAWRYFDPAEQSVPTGMLFWLEENQSAFLVGSQSFLWDKTPLTPAEKSLIKRTGKFKLLNDNTLEGSVLYEYSGQYAIDLKNLMRDKTEAEKENLFVEEAKSLNSSLQVTDVIIENLDDKTKNPIISFKIIAPNYASKTGSRIFLQPGFFKFGAKPLFVSAERVYPVYFDFPWSEEDSVEIEIPQDLSVENAESLTLSASSNQIGTDKIKLAVEDNRKIKYERKFVFGVNGKLLFPVSEYADLKKTFDEFQNIDTKLISLRRK
jgi:hypothetical protein